MLQAYAGGNLFGERFGDGTPEVLALHGWRRSHDDYRAVLGGEGDTAALNAIALDLPGFGATPVPDEPWGSPQYAEHLAPVLTEMADRVVVIGHSFGGRIAPHLANLCGEQIAGVVLTGVPFVAVGSKRQPKLGYRVARTLAGAHLLGEARLERARQRYGSADYRAAQGVMRGVLVRLLGEDYEEALRALSVPTELVWGDLDTAAPPAVGEWAAERISNAHLEVLPGVGHLTPTLAPGALRAALQRVLGRLA